MKPVHLITFDLGGTLLSPHPSVGEAYAEELERLGYLCDAQRLQNRFDLALKSWTDQTGTGTNARDDRESWRSIVADTLSREAIPSARFDEVFEHLYAAFAKSSRWRLHDGANEVLKTLTKRGYRLAILSNNDARCRQVLSGHALIDHFEALFLSGEIGFEKPDPRIFNHVVACTGVRPAHILHVGDSPRHDLEGARKCGWQTYLVSTHGKTLRGLPDALPPLPE